MSCPTCNDHGTVSKLEHSEVCGHTYKAKDCPDCGPPKPEKVEIIKDDWSEFVSISGMILSINAIIARQEWFEKKVGVR